MPSERAKESPICAAFKYRMPKAHGRIPHTVTAANFETSARATLEKEPRPQETKPLSDSAELATIRHETTASTKYPTIKPIIKRETERVTNFEANRTRSTTEKAPTAAKGTTPNEEPPKPAKRTRATPRFAPEFTPKTNGPASGFLKTLCKTSPETASEPPEKSAAHAFGIRICQTTSPAKGSPTPNKASRTSAKASGADPQKTVIPKRTRTGTARSGIPREARRMLDDYLSFTFKTDFGPFPSPFVRR